MMCERGFMTIQRGEAYRSGQDVEAVAVHISRDACAEHEALTSLPENDDHDLEIT